jgi:hypothetical protein
VWRAVVGHDFLDADAVTGLEPDGTPENPTAVGAVLIAEDSK